MRNSAEGAKPFAEIGAEFLEFIAGATLVFHNASFDLGFIKKELADAGLSSIDAMPVINTLSMARQCFPKQPNNLDALCDRFAIDRSHRALHGAFNLASFSSYKSCSLVSILRIASRTNSLALLYIPLATFR